MNTLNRHSTVLEYGMSTLSRQSGELTTGMDTRLELLTGVAGIAQDNFE